MTDTINNAIPFVPENTIDPAAGLNLSLNTIDALLQVLVQTVGLNTPPAGVEGQRFIVGTAPTGPWAGQANRMARFLDGTYQFFDARYALNAADGLWYVRSASTWAPLAGGGGATLPVVQALSSTRNLVLADINTFNVNSTGTDYTVTIQPQSAETWTADAEIHFLPTSTGNIVITGGAGVSLNGVVAGSVTLSTQNGAASIKRTAVDTWWVGGVLGTKAEQRADLGLGTAATHNTGTIGDNVPLLSTGNTWSATQTVNSGGSAYVSVNLVRTDQGTVGETDTGILDIQTGSGALRLLHDSSLGQRWITISRGGDSPQYQDGTALRTIWHSGNFDPAAKQDAIAAGSTAQFWRGDKTWQDLATAVRAVVLTGLSTASAVAVAATDTVLAAIGKLQAQINGLSAASYTNLTLLAPYTWDSAGDAADYSQPSYAKVGDVVRLRGKVTLAGTHATSATVNVTTIATLPVGFRPAKRKAFQVFWDTDSPLHFAYCLVFVNADGGIVLLTPSPTQPYPFTEGHLPLDQIWFDLAL